jgi:hypothetical protein
LPQKTQNSQKWVLVNSRVESAYTFREAPSFPEGCVYPLIDHYKIHKNVSVSFVFFVANFLGFDRLGELVEMQPNVFYSRK